MADELDDIGSFESKDTSHRIPVGWVILFWALILWGIVYLYSYTPSLGGWSQGGAYEESLKQQP